MDQIIVKAFARIMGWNCQLQHTAHLLSNIHKLHNSRLQNKFGMLLSWMMPLVNVETQIPLTIPL